jgi:hypothetical protein
MVVRVLLIVGDQLLVVLAPNHEVLLNKLNQPVRVRVLLVLEVQSFSCLHDIESLLVSLMLQDQLLQE